MGTLHLLAYIWKGLRLMISLSSGLFLFKQREKKKTEYTVYLSLPVCIMLGNYFLSQNLWNEISIQHGNYGEKITSSHFCSAPLCHWCCPCHIPTWTGDEKCLYPDQAACSTFLVWYILNTEEGSKLVTPESILLMSQTELLAKLKSLVTRLLTPRSAEVWKGSSKF